MFKKAILISLLLTAGCSLLPKTVKQPLYASEQYYNYLQPTFDDYIAVSKAWLKDNRSYITHTPDKELSMNAPFALGNKANLKKAILLVHGLGDSPYSFSDIAQTLHQQGFYVQTLLLPGHGSKYQDLQLPQYTDWQEIVDYYANMLTKEFEHVWLGGYSTGGNLVTIHAIENSGIEGLMLFAPGFQSKVPFIEKFAPFVSLFTDGVERNENNLAKYTSGAINGAIAYSNSASKLRKLLKNNTVTIPTLIVISEADSVVDSEKVRELYLQQFKNSKNKMVWYGNGNEQEDSVQVLPMTLDEQRITTGSHMSPLFSADNPYYGRYGERRTCKIDLKEPINVSWCKNKDFWFAAWGYQEDGKKHTRLTWNPYFTELEKNMFNIVN